jgi:hypothetical protein
MRRRRRKKDSILRDGVDIFYPGSLPKEFYDITDDFDLDFFDFFNKVEIMRVSKVVLCCATSSKRCVETEFKTTPGRDVRIINERIIEE